MDKNVSFFFIKGGTKKRKQGVHGAGTSPSKNLIPQTKVENLELEKL